MPHPLIYAHRGARCVAPENTLPAFAAALAMGVDGIELDAHLTSDGEIVVIHDFTVEKTTNGHGAVRAMTLHEVRQLDAGSHFDPRFSGTPVPTLDEVFDLVGDRCAVNVEIKSFDLYAAQDPTDAVVALIHRRRLAGQVIISSFNPLALLKVRHLDPALSIGLLHGGEMPRWQHDFWTSALQPQAQHPWHPLIDAAYMAWAQSVGALVNTWTVNDVAEAQRLAALGVNVLMTDVPDQIMAGLRTA